MDDRVGPRVFSLCLPSLVRGLYDAQEPVRLQWDLWDHRRQLVRGALPRRAPDDPHGHRTGRAGRGRGEATSANNATTLRTKGKRETALVDLAKAMREEGTACSVLERLLKPASGQFPRVAVRSRCPEPPCMQRS